VYVQDKEEKLMYYYLTAVATNPSKKSDKSIRDLLATTVAKPRVEQDGRKDAMKLMQVLNKLNR